MRILHVLVTLAVLWCGVHLGEPARAGEDALSHQVEHASASHLTTDAAGDPDDKIAHSGHHHCPIAPDPCAGPAGGSVVPVRSMVHPGRFAALASLSQPPPLQPPLA